MRTHTKETQHELTPELALDILKEGNERFVNNIKAHRNLLEQVNETSSGQFPFAAILSCIDSRTSAELIFDQGLAGKENLPPLLTARDVLEFATIEGARANGLAGKVGTLTPGKEADVILLRTDQVNIMPVNDPVGAVVWGMDTSNVDSVFVAGNALKRNGRLVSVDLDRVGKLVHQSRDYVVEKSGFKMPAF